MTNMNYYEPFPSPSFSLGTYSSIGEPLAKYLDPRVRQLFPPGLLLRLRQRYTYKKFEGATHEQSMVIVDKVFYELTKDTELSLIINNLEADIQRIAPNADASRIARTEVDKLVNMGRALRWADDDPIGTEYLYRLVGTRYDSCPAHKILVQMIGEGMPLPQLKIVINAIRRKYFPKMSYTEDDPFFLHPNERHRPARRKRT